MIFFVLYVVPLAYVGATTFDKVASFAVYGRDVAYAALTFTSRGTW